MKRFVLPVVAALAVGATAPALGQTLPRNNQELETLLNLSAEQKKRLAGVNARFEPREKALAGKYQPRVQDLQRQLADLQQRYFTELKPLVDEKGRDIEAILTPSQREKLKKVGSQYRQRLMELQQQKARAVSPTPKR